MKILKLYLIFVITIFIFSNSYCYQYSYNWPFKENNDFITQQKIRQTLGAYRTIDRFHNGVDIVPNQSSNIDVYTVAPGKVKFIFGNQIRIGNFV